MTFQGGSPNKNRRLTPAARQTWFAEHGSPNVDAHFALPKILRTWCFAFPNHSPAEKFLRRKIDCKFDPFVGKMQNIMNSHQNLNQILIERS
ncbi:MAG: hypothetical protein ACRCUY_02855 [Thermoguttaceae bacterium]